MVRSQRVGQNCLEVYKETVKAFQGITPNRIYLQRNFIRKAFQRSTLNSYSEVLHSHDAEVTRLNETRKGYSKDDFPLTQNLIMPVHFRLR